MRADLSRTLELSYPELFYIEQLAALLLGGMCLGVAIWAGFSEPVVTPTMLHLGLDKPALSIFKNVLSIIVSLIGMALVRFAFYKPIEKESGAKPLSGAPHPAQVNSGKQARAFKLIADRKDRG